MTTVSERPEFTNSYLVSIHGERTIEKMRVLLDIVGNNICSTVEGHYIVCITSGSQIDEIAKYEWVKSVEPYNPYWYSLDLTDLRFLKI